MDCFSHFIYQILFPKVNFLGEKLKEGRRQKEKKFPKIISPGN